MKNNLYRIKILEAFSGNFTEGEVYWVYADGPFEYVDDDRNRRIGMEALGSYCEWAKA